MVDTHTGVLKDMSMFHLKNESVHDTIGLALHRLDSALLEKTVTSKLLLSDILVNTPESGVLPPAT